MVVTELVTKFGFEGSAAPLENFNESLNSSIKFIAGTVAAVAGLSAAFVKLSLDTYQAVDPLVQLQRETGVSIEAMQELGYIASVSGSNLGAVTTTIEGLSQKIGEASLKGSEDFARLGISVRDANGNIKDADQVLMEVGNRFKTLGLSLEQQRSIASSLGIDTSLLQMLNRSGAEMDSLAAKARAFGIVTKEQGDQLADVNDAFTTSKFAMQSLTQQITLGIAPELKNMADSFSELLLENGAWIKEAAQKTIDVVISMMDAFKRLAPVLGVITIGIIAAKIATIDWAAAMTVALSPAYLIAAAVAAALIIIDDLIVAFHGGKSVIADFFQEFLGVDIRPILQDIVAGVEVYIGIVKAFWQGVYDLAMGVADAVKAAWASIGETIGAITGGISDSIDTVKDTFSDVTDWFSGDDSVEVNKNLNLQNAPIRNDMTRQPMQQNTSSQDNRSVTQTNNIQISATNADEARVGVEDALQNNLQFADDVLRVGGV